MKQENQPDEYHGVGGSYVIDPATGLRRRADEVQADAPAASGTADAQPDNPPADPAAADPSVKTPRRK